jgi:hypothetical protein
MKKCILVFIFSFFISCAWSQALHVTATIINADGDKENVTLANGKDLTLSKDAKGIKTLIINSDNLPAGDKLVVSAVNDKFEYTSAGTAKVFTFKTDLIGNEITIQHFDKANLEIGGDLIKFRMLNATGETGDDGTRGGGTRGGDVNVAASIMKQLDSDYPDIKATPFGYISPKDKDHIIHVFFDYLGNSLMSTPPSGISNAQYMVHIYYPSSSAEPDKISYSVKQKSGSFNSSLVFNNTNIRGSIPGILQSGEKIDKITHKSILLATATDDLSFDVVASSKDGSTITKTVLESYTIKMSPTYHGSFDIGLIKTKLSNPIYTMVQLPGTTDSVVKQTNESPKMVATVMASFYVSPIILLESLLGIKSSPFYKITGRNFLDDHKIYERFYPTIGIGVSDKALQNFFFGINWEIARGLAVFGGWHYGKVHTFNMPGYKVMETKVTRDQFDFYQNDHWETGKAFGAKIDIMVIRNLFGASTP